MKSVNKSRKLMSRAVSAVVCLALILCTALSFCFINTKPIASSAEESRVSETGIRFVQVAAGSDFAIGLTYNGDLYGWSLLEEGYGQSPANAKTLGQYYTKTPRQIPVIFRNGPGTSGDQRRWSNSTYHSAIDLNVSSSTATQIIEVVATSTTAAFITANGTIYTWGKDILDIGGYGNEPDNYLLLRNPNDNTSNPWYLPYIIDYGFFTRNDQEVIPAEFQQIRPVLTNPTIAAAENNYIISFSKNNRYYTYVWGSLMYATRMMAKTSPAAYRNFQDTGNGLDLINGAYSDTYRTVFQTKYSDSNMSVRAVAGGYTVGINAIASDSPSVGTTSLSLRGKNFISSDNVLSQVGDSSDYTYDISRVAATQSKEYTYTTADGSYTTTEDGTSMISYTIDGSTIKVSGAVIGDFVTSAKSDSGIISGVENTSTDIGDLVMGRLASGTSSDSPALKFTTSSSSRMGYINSAQADGEGAPTELNESTYAKPIYYDVSLGYDVGYAIANGILYSWGDDTYGQSGRNSTLTTYANSWAYPATTSTVGSSTRVISVAAGKQLSNTAKAFNYSKTLDGVAGSYTFNEAVVNDGSSPYITGALTETGAIIVWNKETRTNGSTQTLNYGGVALNAKDKFAAVYSGYGNHLFAVTTFGKLVHITYDEASAKFVQEIYDDFVVADMPLSSGKINYTVAGDFGNVKVANSGQNRVGDPINIDYVKLTNWTKAVDTDNPVTFTVDGEGDEPDLGEMIVYLDYLKVSQTTVELHDNNTEEEDVESGLTYSGSRGSLVTSNGIGDVYRILDSDMGDIGFVNTTGTESGSRILTKDDLKLKFKLYGAEEYMTDAQISFMFDYDIVYSSAYGVGIKIDPKQSSQDLWVVVEFYVARYDSLANFRITNEEPLGYDKASVADNAIYYDYQQCSFRFKINNTVPYRHQTDFETIEEERDGNSYIPLLDPNNEYNSVYSVAVQNVSGGVEALAKYLTNSSDPSTFVDRLVEQMIIADRADGMADGNTSYPATSRIASGNLDYYFGSTASAAKYYSNRYQYLLEDRDADVLILNSGAVTLSEINGANKGAVTAARATITITDFDISSYSISEERISALATDFNNKYGLYNIKITDDMKLSFSYEIIRFTAVGATGQLTYSDNDITKVNTVRSGNAYEQVNVAVMEYSVFSATDYLPTFTRGAERNVPNAFAVFSQPSLRLKSTYKTASGDVIYGKADDTGVNNTYTETLTMSVGGTFTRTLSDYVANAGAKTGTAGVTSQSSAIYFSFDNSHTDFEKFNSGFHDETSMGENIVTLTADTLTVKPTTSHPINFSITIQRFHSSQNASTFGDNEKITIVFNFTSVSDFSFALSGGKTSGYSVDKKTSCDILGGSGSGIENLINISPADYKTKIKIDTPRSNNTNVLTVSKTGDTTFDVVPVSSGKAIVMLVASVYDKSLVITLEFSVSGLTMISDTVDLIDTSYVYVNSLIGDLRQANTFNTRINNYGVLFDDVNETTGIPNALYFTNDKGEAIDGYPSFISRVRFTNYSSGSSNPRIAIDFDSDAHITTGNYYLRVRYVDTSRGYASYADAVAAGDTVLETSQLVRSAKHVVPGTNGEQILTIYADCDVSVDMDLSNPDDYWYTKGTNTDMVIYIPVKMLMKEVAEAPETFRIFLVTSTTEAANYFNYSFDSSGKNVLIHPLYDTPEPIMVNVSVRSTDAMSAQTNQVVSFRIKTEGISTTLEKKTYVTIWLVAFFASFGVLFIIFLIRMIVYWRRRAKQRALIKRNQELIKMRDRVHNKASAATKEQLVRSKMKMEDPKYAKLFNEMKKDRQASATGGVTLESMSTPGEAADGKKGKKKKKNGKKSIAELKAELEAKKAAFAQAQSGDAGVPPFGAGAPQPDFGAQPDFGGQPDFGAQGMGFDPNQNFGSPADAFVAPDIEANPIIFDVADDPGVQG